MSIVPEAEPLADAIADPVTKQGRGWVRFLKRPSAIFGVSVILFFVAVAILAPWIAPYGKNEKVGPPFEPPSWAHPLGLDGGGVDMLTLMMYGAQVSLIVGFAAAAVAMILGGTVGLTAGYYGGKTDTVLARITDYFLVIPDIPLIIVAAAIWGRSLTNVIVIIGLIYWTTTARLVRVTGAVAS